MRLGQLHAATRLEDLRWPQSNRLEALTGDRVGQDSIRIYSQWRLCFRFRDGDAFDVEICDYHHRGIMPIAFHPGEFLKEILDELPMSQAEFARPGRPLSPALPARFACPFA
jgi:hypothetical protein